MDIFFLRSKCMKRLQTSGFTLIELLIVVAIIAILAAIAVPNFLEAQTRAKVSRTKSDLRSYATAIESYTVDNNVPPREYDQSIDGTLPTGGGGGGVMSPVLSTPIAYITEAYGYDPFIQKGENIPDDEQTFSYASVPYRRANGLGFFFNPGAGLRVYDIVESNLGTWYILGIGPDRDYFNNLNGVGRGGVVGREYILYDPTNGTISEGNIYRGQKINFDQQPSDPEILGPH